MEATVQEGEDQVSVQERRLGLRRVEKRQKMIRQSEEDWDGCGA